MSNVPEVGRKAALQLVTFPHFNLHARVLLFCMGGPHLFWHFGPACPRVNITDSFFVLTSTSLDTMAPTKATVRKLKGVAASPPPPPIQKNQEVRQQETGSCSYCARLEPFN